MKKFCVLFLSVFAMLTAGCAGNVPSAEFRSALAPDLKLCQTDDASVSVKAATGVKVEDSVLKRIEGLIKQSISAKKQVAQCPATTPRNYTLTSELTEYNDGNAFLRSMFAGLGQMHINGNFILAQAVTGDKQLADFSINKTFAWGGLYGMTQRIEGIEPAFAESVAEAIVAEAPKK